MTRLALIGVSSFLAVPALAYQLTTVDQLEPYEPAALEGTVERVTDSDTFVFEDATGSIRVYIGPHRMPVGAGDAVTVKGRLDDDLPREVYADQLVLSDGQVIEVGGPYE
ncbi:MAG: NirD/YgiW/YdeI family stress tolerance protein [Hyphomicrobiales bacterium]